MYAGVCARVCAPVYVFIRVSLYPQQGCARGEERRGRDGERGREKELSGWGGAREGRIDVFDG